MTGPLADEGTVEFVRVMLAARGTPYAHIAKLIGRSEWMVRSIARRLGLTSAWSRD